MGTFEKWGLRPYGPPRFRCNWQWQGSLLSPTDVWSLYKYGVCFNSAQQLRRVVADGLATDYVYVTVTCHNYYTYVYSSQGQTI